MAQGTQNIYNKSPGYEQWQKQHNESEQNTQLLAMPTLPELPQYPRKTTFLGGKTFPNAGPSYFFRFSAMEEIKPILDWYQSALVSSGWKIGNANASAITANMESTGSNVSISLKPDAHGTGRTSILITYTKGRQHGLP